MSLCYLTNVYDIGHEPEWNTQKEIDYEQMLTYFTT